MRNKKNWIFGAVLLAGGMSFSIHSAATAAKEEEGIRWLTDFDAALKQANAEKKLIVVDFFATWCGPCKEMDRTTFQDAEVIKKMAAFIPLKIDVDKHEDIAARYGIEAMPTSGVLDAEGNPLLGARGYMDAADFIKFLERAESGERQTPEPQIVGAKAPSLGVTTWFNLPTGKKTLDVADYKGKVVYLFGFQSWCPGCHKVGFPALTRIMEHYKGNEGVAFIAVQTVFEGFETNTPEKAKATADQYKLTIPVGHSGSEKARSTVMERYRTGGTPWVTIIDREGIVRYNDFHIEPKEAIEMMERLLAMELK